MITTVCMNPSFDKTASVENLTPGALNRLENVRVDLGGKGLNVAIVLKRLGVEAGCVGCLGENNAAEFLQMIAREKVPFDSLRLPGDVRTNLKLLDSAQKNITELNEPGPRMTEEQFQAFLGLLKEKGAESDYIVLSGRLLLDCKDDSYQRCMAAMAGKKCILDAAGDALLYGIKEKPYLIKPNLPEMEAVVKKELKTLRGIRDAALFMMEYGARNVIVSMGKYGAMLVTQGKTYFSQALNVKVRSTVGAGDAMIGGLLLGLARGLPIEEAFRFGVAAGAASVMTDGTQLLRKSDFEALAPQVTVQEV